MSLRLRIALSILVICLLLTGLVMAVLVADARSERSSYESAREVLINSAREQAATVAGVIGGQSETLRAMAASLEYRAVSIEDFSPESLESVASVSGFDTIFMARADGSVIDYGDGINISDRVYFQRALSGEASMEYAVFRYTGRDGVVLAVPYYHEGQVGGVLFGIVYEESLGGLLSSEKYGGSGYSFLADGMGNIVVSADSEFDDLEGVSLFELSDELAIEGYDNLEAGFKDLLSGKIDFFSYTYQGKARVGAAAPLASSQIPANDWYVFSIIDQAELDAEIRANRRNALEPMEILAVFFVLALIIFLFLERDSRRQLEKEAETERRLADAAKLHAEDLRSSEELFRIVVSQCDRHVYRYEIEEGGSSIPDGSFALGRVAEGSRERYRKFFEDINSGKSPLTADIEFEMHVGGARWYRHNSTTLFSADGRPKTAVISYYDCTQEHDREQTFTLWEQRIASLSGEHNAMFEWNLTLDRCEGVYGAIAESFVKTNRSSFRECAKAFVDTHIYKDDVPAFTQLMSRERLIGNYFDGLRNVDLDFRCARSDGEISWINVNVNLSPYPDTQEIKAYILFTDIDSEKREKLELIARSEHDDMTGLLNRKAFIRRVENLLERSSQAMHLLIMLDLDGFKQINDSLGHDAGDKALTAFAERLRTLTRSTDLSARIGGDEFMVFLPNMPKSSDLAAKVKSISGAMRDIIDLGGETKVSASLGAAVYPRDGRSYEELYKSADTALYYTKTHGKSGYSFFEEWMNTD
ncbi:MAG: sensor domain-containing diguanylate cyclase [Oscillospiraceae bacterium]|nr:sensor domain-containing diguanylate cyclase [Oscillospiraceae bacterium]